MCVVVRYLSSAVQAPVMPVSVSGVSSLMGWQLVVDTTLLLHLLSAQSGQSVSAHHQQQSIASDRSSPLDLQTLANSQMSCPMTSPCRLLQATSLHADFATDDVVFSKWLSCTVSHIDNPEKFYCQLSGSNNSERLQTLMASINSYVTHLPPGIGKLRAVTLGQPVIAKYSQDNTWYRAQVTGTLLSCVVCCCML